MSVACIDYFIPALVLLRNLRAGKKFH
jgi:hypothetical protein